MYPHEHKDIIPKNHDCTFGALIWNTTKTYNDIKICKEAKTIIVVDIWLKLNPRLEKQGNKELKVS